MSDAAVSSRAVAAPPSTRRLWVEVLVLFVGAPLLMAAYFGQYSLFAVLWSLAAVAALLLAMTPGFSWRLLWRAPRRADWLLVPLVALATALVALPFVLWLAPGALLGLPRHRPGLWLAVMTLYPLLSAWPQELIYRTLFFERYGRLWRGARTSVAANGLLFGLGHLFYMNPLTIAMTAAGGALMGWAYLRDRSLPLAWAIHAVAGQVVFTMGLGRYFYHGTAQ